MFIGHFGAGLGAKRFAPTLSLGSLFLASQWIDLIWPFLLLLGAEHVVIDPGNTVVTPLDFTDYPITHSLLAVVIWGVLLGSVYYLFKKNLKNALWIAGLVCSHWFLDLIVHRPDLPLLPGGELKVGFGLWNSLVATLIIEGSVFALGIMLYLKVTKASNRTGTYALWALVIFLSIVYISNLFGPPPPSEQMIGIVGLSQWLLVAWAYWIDRNRTITKPLL
jgi:membrane-bound metal-dependent hydrolase YbcI (DUF457 family)